MADTLNEAFEQYDNAVMLENITGEGIVNEKLSINPVTRGINVPVNESLFGVYTDKDVERKYFTCPRYVGDYVDLSQCFIFINYVTASGNYGQYLCDDVTVVGENIEFTWLLSGNVFDSNKESSVYFAVQAKSADSEGNLKNRFNTKKAIGKTYSTIESSEQIEEQYADVILQIISRIETLEQGGTISQEQIQEAVNNYMEENPIQAGATAEQAAQIRKNTEDISKLSEELVASVPTDASIIFDYPNYKSGCGGDDGFYRRMYFFGDSTIKGTTTVLGSDRATLCLPYLFLQHVANASGKATTAESTSNKAIGGASFTTSAKTYFGSNGSLISDQITNLNSTQFGSIFISAGINDCRASSAISEFKNSVSDVMDNLGQNLTNENTIVFWITPFLCPSCEGKNSAGLTLQDYRDAIVDVIHSKRKSSNIKHSIIDGRFLGLVDVDTLYYTDKLHPSAVGNEIIAKNIFDLLYDPTIL